MMMSYLIFIMSMIFMMLSHPISLSMVILIQTMFISLKTSMQIKLSWFSYVLFLVMIGGMLVLFLYMTNVASNEKFSISNKLIFMMVTLLPVSTIALMMNKTQKLKLNEETSINYQALLNKMFYEPMSTIIIMMMIYLLITMVMTVKITDINKGPLRKNN